MMQLIIVAWCKTLGHWRNALAITRADQPRDVKRTHPSPRLVTQTLKEWLEPLPKLAFPIRPRVRHGRPSIKQTTHESRKNCFGNPATLKICHSSANPRSGRGCARAGPDNACR